MHLSGCVYNITILTINFYFKAYFLLTTVKTFSTDRKGQIRPDLIFESDL